jgi:cobyrinic acid a,c-diamide synthase
MAAAVTARFDVDGIIAVARGAADDDAGRMQIPQREPWVGVTQDDGIAGRPSQAHVATGTADSDFGGAKHHRGGPFSRAVGHPGSSAGPGERARGGQSRPVIAVARDEAFCFYYPENLELLVEAGAEVEFFSPLRGERPSAAAKGVYLGGGYPELHGPALASNTDLWRALEDMHADNEPIFAECGGFMVLTEGLTDSQGHTWPMAGLLPGLTKMTGKLAALGYRHATAMRPNLLVEPGEALRGHEFRYSTWVREAGAVGHTAAWEVRGTRGKVPDDSVGYVSGNLLASYLHIHFGQNRQLAQRFVRRL